MISSSRESTTTLTEFAQEPRVYSHPIDVDEVLDAFGITGHPALRDGDPEVEPDNGQLIATEPCPVCGCQKAARRYRIKGMQKRVVECVDCQTGALHPRPTATEVRSYYPSQYYGATGAKFEPLTEWMVCVIGARHARQLTKGLPAGARVLDFGCGRGVLLKALLDRGYEAHGTEVSRHAAEGADPRAQIRIANNLVNANYPDEHFDQIIVWHVLEHLTNPRETLQEMRRILRPGGRIVVAVPNFASWQSQLFGAAWFHLDLPRHLFHFTENSLQRLLTETGFLTRSSHHFSLRQNPYGWVQSELNRLGFRRNELYEMLHNGAAAASGSRMRRWIQRCAYWAGLPVGLGLSVLAAAAGRGATVHAIAERPLESEALESEQLAVAEAGPTWG